MKEQFRGTQSEYRAARLTRYGERTYAKGTMPEPGQGEQPPRGVAKEFPKPREKVSLSPQPPREGVGEIKHATEVRVGDLVRESSSVLSDREIRKTLAAGGTLSSDKGKWFLTDSEGKRYIVEDADDGMGKVGRLQEQRKAGRLAAEGGRPKIEVINGVTYINSERIAGIESPRVTAIAEGRGGRGREDEEERRWNLLLQNVEAATQNGDFDLLESTIAEYLDLNSPNIPRVVMERLAQISFSDAALNNNMYGYALEYAIERFLSIADATPTGTYPEPTFYQRENIARIISVARDFDRDIDKSQYIYLKELEEKRRISHELFRSMKEREQYKKIVTDYLRTEGFEFLENKIVGVAPSQILWEKVLGHRVSQRRDWLTQDDFREAYGEVRSLLVNLQRSGDIKKRFTVRMSPEEVRTQERVARPWEIERAGIVGRAVAAASQRRTSYGVLGELPSGVDELFRSLDSEYIARVIGARKVIGQRFIAQGFSASKKYMEIWVKNMAELARSKGQTYGTREMDEHGKEKGLYGHTAESFTLLDSGIPDVKSHSWRSRLMFLKNKEYAKSGVEGKTIGDYLDEEWPEVNRLSGTNLERELQRVLSRMTSQQRIQEERYLNDDSLELVMRATRIKNIIFSARVRDVVLNQRLYHGTLLREAHFTDRLRADIWKNVARCLPSRIAAFFPEERRGIIGDEAWENLRLKLYMAETRRVEAQALQVRENDLTEERLGDHYGADITPGEREIIRRIIEFGESKAEQLAKIIFPFNAFLDDVPEAAWLNLEEADLQRLLVGDHDSYNAAVNAEIGAVITHPDMPPSQAVEHYTKAANNYASPLGPEGAQVRMEADVLTHFEMSSTFKSVRWIPGLYVLKRLSRQPTSEIEKHNIDSYISNDARETEAESNLLAQNGVISSNVNNRDARGRTQLERIKEGAGARRRDVWLERAWVVAQLLIALGLIELAKVLIPDENMRKALGV